MNTPTDPRPPASLQPAYFDAVYAARADPWNFEGSDYERAKYVATMAALPMPRYLSGFEIGCSIGVLTAQLADRCDRLLAVDVSAVALAAAQRRLAARAHVRIEKMAAPGRFPAGHFDLVMLSEVGYYWSPADLALASRRIVDALSPGGHLVLVHWTPRVADYPLDGDDVHAHFLDLAEASDRLRHLAGSRAACYRLDVFERAAEDQPRSPASAMRTGTSSAG